MVFGVFETHGVEGLVSSAGVGVRMEQGRAIYVNHIIGATELNFVFFSLLLATRLFDLIVIYRQLLELGLTARGAMSRQLLSQ